MIKRLIERERRRPRQTDRRETEREREERERERERERKRDRVIYRRRYIYRIVIVKRDIHSDLIYFGSSLPTVSVYFR